MGKSNLLTDGGNGKGDSPRNCHSEQYRNNYDRIFGAKKLNVIEENTCTEESTSVGFNQQGEVVQFEDS